MLVEDPEISIRPVITPSLGGGWFLMSLDTIISGLTSRWRGLHCLRNERPPRARSSHAGYPVGDRLHVLPVALGVALLVWPARSVLWALTAAFVTIYACQLVATDRFLGAASAPARRLARLVAYPISCTLFGSAA
jgi:hypothetical protein